LKKYKLPHQTRDILRLIIKFIPVYLVLLFFSACDEPDEIGMELIEETDTVNVIDFDLAAYTVPGDTVPTNYTERNLLGFINDPVFGSTKACIFTEFRLRETNLDLGEDPILDSVVLELYYSDYYGNYTTRQNVKVYELAENFPEQETFYSNFEISHMTEPIADTLVRPMPTDSVEVGEDMYPPHMRIRLSKDDIGQKLIEGSGTEHFVDNEAFLDYFKGIHITVDELEPEEDGAILYFSLVRSGDLVSHSQIKLYYHFEGDTVSTTERFPIDDFAKRATNIDHYDYENAHEYLKKQVIDNETSYGDSLLFLQSMGGAEVFIDFPKLDSLAKEDVFVNSAELVVPVNAEDEFYSDLFPQPARLLLLQQNEEGELYHIPDSEFGYFGGRYDEDEKEYRIRITQHIQEVLKDPESHYGLTLINTQSHSNAYRLVLRGSGLEDNPLSLELKYTKD